MNAINGAVNWIDARWGSLAPALAWGLHYVGIVACCLVIGSVCCRIDSMRSGVSSPVWAAIYVMFGMFAMGTLLDQLHGHTVDWYDTLGAVAVLLYLMKTRRRWKRGAPRETRTDFGRLEDLE